MKNKNDISFLFFFYFTALCVSQTAFQNTGNLQMHTGAQVGFHTDLVNDGIFNNNKGLAGFYSDDVTRIVSGNNRTIFFDIEVDAVNHLELLTSLGVTNNYSFINGKKITDKNNTNISLDFINHNFYAGEDDDRHVDGYSSTKGSASSNFTFPIGDGGLFRPMKLSNQSNYNIYKGAYFFEDPNFPTIFPTPFLTNQKQVMLENISNVEFWDLDGKNETRITLTWNERSDITTITDKISLLTVVGWSIAENRWENLNNLGISGNLTKGEITSAVFIPDNYEIITIGAIVDNEISDIDNNNIIISPNGDSLNEYLLFDEIAEYSNNNLVIFNRWGNIVYQANEYKNNWNGFSTGRATYKKPDKLPVGTYFYVLKLGNDPLYLPKTKKGWVYIHR